MRTRGDPVMVLGGREGKGEGRGAGNGSNPVECPVNQMWGETSLKEKRRHVRSTIFKGDFIRTDATEVEKLGEQDEVLKES